MPALLRRLVSFVSASALSLAPVVSVANPLNGQVVGGAASIAGQGTADVVVDQTTSRAIINWGSFNIAPNQTTQFIQPNASSVILNRVTGGLGASEIDGIIKANGGVYIVNPDGILIGPSGQINVGSFLATTHDITNGGFMAGGGNFTISGNPTASIVNQGAITAANGGFAALVAPGVRNDGIITANLGTVALASGNAFTLDLYGDNLIALQANDAIATNVIDVATGQTLKSLVQNTGTLRANGGKVSLTAVAAKTLVDSVINSSGVIEADSVGMKNGLVVFGAATAATKPAGAPTQTVKVSGKISVAGKKPGTTGGKVQISGENIQLAGATIDASGWAGGGAVLIGGVGNSGAGPAIPIASNVSADAATAIDASALYTGNGGVVVAWSDRLTTFAGAVAARGGALSGNGGLVETSGGAVDFAGIRVDTSAPNGSTGSWLLDPYDLTIDSNAATIIATSLATTNVTVETTATGYSGPGTAVQGSGDIDVAANISWSSANTLSLSAYRNINIDPGVIISNSGAGNLVLQSDNTRTGTGGVFFNSNNGVYSQVDFSQSTGIVSISYNTNSIISVQTNANVPNQLQLHLYSGQAAAAYMTGSTDPWTYEGLPSDPGSPDSAMNTAFGVGNWTKFYGFNSAVLGGEYKFVYVDGGDGVSSQFNSFVGNNNNITAMQNFVSSGGSIFLNAALWTAGTDPNTDVSGSVYVGFGAKLNFNADYSLASNTGTAVNPANPIFNGPNGLAGTSWTGNYFSHDVVTGATLQPLITGTAGTVLADEHYGSGYVIVGGITTPFPGFQQPQPQASNLRANILSYAASQYVAPTPQIVLTEVAANGANPAVVNQYTQPNNPGCKTGAIRGFGLTQLAASPTWRNLAREIASAAAPRAISTAELDEAQQQLKVEVPGAEDATALVQRIGSTVIVHNEVDELSGAAANRISVGDNVFLDETVRTGQDSNGKFVLTDATNLAMGPKSTLKLDRFVFSGESNYSKAVLNLTKGTFRFITGNSPKTAYEIDTPTASIGIRGTIVDIKVDKSGTTVALQEGNATVCPRHNRAHCATLAPGETVSVTLAKVDLSASDWTFASACVGNSALCGQTTVAQAAVVQQQVAQASSGPCAP